MRCPECGAENDEFERFCVRCHAPIASYSSTGQHANAQPYDGGASQHAGQHGETTADYFAAGEGSSYLYRKTAAAMAAHKAELAAQHTGPVGMVDDPTFERDRADRGPTTNGKHMMLVVFDVVLLALMSYMPWVSMRSDAVATIYSLPKLALGIIDTASEALSSQSDGMLQAVLMVEVGAAVLWLGMVDLLLVDIYRNMMGYERAGIGYVAALVAVAMTVGAAFFINGIVGMAVPPPELFNLSAPGFLLVCRWPPIVAAVAMVALLIDIIKR